MLDINTDQTNQTVFFGAGSRQLVRKAALEAGGRRILVLTTPHQADLGAELMNALGDMATGIFSNATMHTPTDVTEQAMVHLEQMGADAVLSAGGGSTIGLGKALALRKPLLQIAVPTTYAGSECTPILGQTEDGIKTTMRDDKLRPLLVIYDSELVVGLPTTMTVTSALNAMAHAVEALYAKDRSAESDALALQGLAAFQSALRSVLKDPADLGARELTQKGAWACGTVLGQVGMGLHHKLCHTLGGAFNLPHAETHAIILPHATAYNWPAARNALDKVSRMFGGEAVGSALWTFSKSLGAPTALKDLGVDEADLDHVADLATRSPYENPRTITRDGIRSLLQRAWSGQAPQS